LYVDYELYYINIFDVKILERPKVKMFNVNFLNYNFSLPLKLYELFIYIFNNRVEKKKYYIGQTRTLS